MIVEYGMIKRFYSDRCAKRSGVPLMSHIDEGLAILDDLGAGTQTKAAFCLHPLLQDYAELVNNFEYVLTKANPKAILLAMEYRNKAQAYLCRPHTDNWTQEDIKIYVGDLLPEVQQMLVADKIQNQKDFNIYHKGTHVRSKQLENYFNNWLEYLGGQ